MLGSEFVREYASKGFPAQQAAFLALARQGLLCPWIWHDVTVRTDDGRTCTLSTMADAVAIGTLADHMRMPLTPDVAQAICNMHGWLLPTPWFVFQRWRAAPIKLSRVPMVPNKGADLNQYYAHSLIIDEQIAKSGGPAGGLVDGMGKDVVVDKAMVPGKVVIFGWYKPEPDVWSNGLPMTDPQRQPQQPLSNVHGDFYVDYSHMIRPVAGTCVVDGKPMSTEALYRDPVLSKLVSNTGPVPFPRYSSREPVVMITSPEDVPREPLTLVEEELRPGPSVPSSGQLGVDLLSRPRT